MKNYIQEGKNMPYTNTSGSTIASGSPVLVGSKLGIATGDIANNALGVLAMFGVFTITKATGTGFALAQGGDVYWDNSAKKVTYTSNSGANKRIGFAFAAAADNDASASVSLNV